MGWPEYGPMSANIQRETSGQLSAKSDQSMLQRPELSEMGDTHSQPPLHVQGSQSPHNGAKERARDWEWGLITGHRLRVASYLCIAIFTLSLLQELIGLRSQRPVELFDQIWSWGTLLWLGAVFPVTIGLVGMLSFRFPNNLDDVEPIANTICWRIVSSGKNLDVLRDTIDRCKEEMARVPLFPYIIEVVIDFSETTHLLASNDPRIRLIVVPSNFITPRHTRFKARALHYALLNSPLPNDAWIVHLDEETRPTSSGIRGICRMVREEESSKQLRIGQGAILYHRQWKQFPILTLADNVRTGDDFSRFYFQHRIGMTIFGIHGSFIVVRNDIEKLTGGFDFGPQGDITEDAFWAVMAMEQGLRSRWVGVGPGCSRPSGRRVASDWGIRSRPQISSSGREFHSIPPRWQ